MGSDTSPDTSALVLFVMSLEDDVEHTMASYVRVFIDTLYAGDGSSEYLRWIRNW